MSRCLNLARDAVPRNSHQCQKAARRRKTHTLGAHHVLYIYYSKCVLAVHQKADIMTRLTAVARQEISISAPSRQVRYTNIKKLCKFSARKVRARNSRDANLRYENARSHVCVTKSGTFGTYQYQSVTLIERAHVLYKKRVSHADGNS